MRNPDEWQPPTPQAPDSRRGALLGVIILIVLVIGGVWLSHRLSEMSREQDCALSGRANCTSP